MTKPARPLTPPARVAAHPSRPMPEAVIYARVSSKDQEREGFSIPAQQHLLRGYADQHGLAVVQEFIDVETAKRAGRTNFVKMLKYFRKRTSCRVLLVEKTDRLYRNLKDWVTLDGMNLEIHLVKEGGVISEESRSGEKFIHGIKVLMAKNYIDNLSEESRKGMQEKARQGIWPARAPLGYLNVQRADGKRVIEVDPVRGPIMRRVFEWYATGNYSLDTLCAKARDEGLRARRSNVPLRRNALHLLLQNPLYKGEYEWDGSTYQGIHAPLTTPAIWEHVQDVLHGRGRRSGHSRSGEFIFTGLISCATCAGEGEQRLLIGSVAKQTYHYYHCEGCRRMKRATYFKEEAIDAEFVRALGRLRLDAEVLSWVRTALRSNKADRVKHRGDELARLQREHAQLQRRIDAAYDDRLDGRIDAAFFDRKAREWRTEQERLQHAISSHTAADQGNIEAGISLLELAQRAVRLYESQTTPEKRRLLEFVYLNSLYDGEQLRVTWRQPFDILAESIEEAKTKTAPEERSEGRFAKWLPTTDGARTGVQCVFVRLSKRFPRRGRVEVVEVAPKLSKQDRAERWAAMIDGVAIRNRADLARKLGVSRARVTQVLGALNLDH